MLLKLKALLLVVICTAGAAKADELKKDSSPEPDVEFRGAWVQSRNIDTKVKCDIALNTASEANLNAIFTYGPWPMVG